MSITKRQVIDAELRGRMLSQMMAEQLEQHILENERDLECRVALISYYKAHLPWSPETPQDSRLFQHILWIIDHVPQSPAAGCVSIEIDKILYPIAYQRCRDLWWEHINSGSAEAAVYDNAAKFLSLNQPDESIEIISRARVAVPTHHSWGRRLAKLYLDYAKRKQGSEKRQMIREGENAYQEYRAVAGERCFITELKLADSYLEIGELDTAAQYANSILKELNSQNFFDVNVDEGFCKHRVHTILGLAAMSRNEVRIAEAELQKSIIVRHSAVLSAFGPTMSLAHQLLLCGKRLTVLRYLVFCLRIWPSGRRQVITWIFLVTGGLRPRFDNQL